MMQVSEKVTYLFAFILALFSWWLLEYTGVVDFKPKTSKKTGPDYFSTGYGKVEMDERGIIKNRLEADEMTHMDAYWATKTKNPVMTFYNDNRPPWVIRSQTGILSKDGEKLQLNGKVLIERDRGQDVKPLKINTSNLLVNPKTSYAETKAWAELISPPHITSGTGMKVTFKEPIHLELLSKVKGRYETK